ncbi:MAG: dolichyl-phosphate-mannose--protein mannosyltransferase, partial [Myxococcota bacterium]
FAAWISHHHFNMLSPHWSQYHLWQTYYDERKGDEPVYAYQLNWRGETFYSRNTVLQVKESGANQRIRRLVDLPGREFIITEQSRFHTLKNVLSPDKRNKLHILDRSNAKFYLCVVDE